MDHPGYEEVEHTADWALRVRGADLADLCVQSARGMLHLAGVEVASGQTWERRIELEAPDPEALLVRWLEEMLFDLETRRRVPVEFRVRSPGRWRLDGTVIEEPLLRIDKAIKAVTFNDLSIRWDAAGCETTIVFDV